MSLISAEQSRLIEEAHLSFIRRQVALGNDSAVPDGRPDGSDWNQHAPFVKGDAAGWDEYDAEVRQILGLPPLAGAAQ